MASAAAPDGNLVRISAAAAAELGCSVKTLRRRIQTGDLTGYRLGQKIILVDLDEALGLIRRIPSANGHGRQTA